MKKRILDLIVLVFIAITFYLYGKDYQKKQDIILVQKEFDRVNQFVRDANWYECGLKEIKPNL